ncbi:GNAT family N-acetyltransferase [Rhizobium sp. SGZ-381]|uniref:GNAT family N-acetyltransferase n=1 Tax=Rhizobium sp. SGZ-381 TaxID=3342800 RepID=UPI00366E13C7
MKRDILTYLNREPLKTISLSKYLHGYPQDTQAFHVRGQRGEAVLVLLRVSASAYDRETYPTAGFVCFIASDDPELTTRLLAHVPRDCRLVFKLAGEADRVAVAKVFDLRRTTSFLSFTGQGPAGSCEADLPRPVTGDLSPEAWSLFEARGYARDWLMPLLKTGCAFVVEACHEGAAVSVCFAFQNSGDLWEVGGLSTRPDARRKGHAARVVRAAFAELERRSLQGRYVVEETNLASLQLARSIGLQHKLTLTHFFALAPNAGNLIAGSAR